MGSRGSKGEEALPPLELERLMGETGFAKRHVTMLHMRFREGHAVYGQKGGPYVASYCI